MLASFVKCIPLCHTEQWVMTIDNVNFTDYQGECRADMDSEVQSLFTAWDLEEQENTLRPTSMCVS